MSDIVDLLRSDPSDGLNQSAADEIVCLRAEVERLKKCGTEDVCRLADLQVENERLQNDKKAYAFAYEKRISELETENERLKALIMELVIDLEAEVNGHYSGLLDHPAMQRRYKRDIATVRKARAALDGEKG